MIEIGRVGTGGIPWIRIHDRPHAWAPSLLVVGTGKFFVHGKTQVEREARTCILLSITGTTFNI